MIVCCVRSCQWSTAEPVKRISEARIVWHFYRTHPDIWLELIGDRLPQDPNPDSPVGYALLTRESGAN